MPSLWPVPEAPAQAAPGPSSLSTSSLLQEALALALRAFNVPRSDLDELQERTRSWSFDRTSTASDTSLYKGDAQADAFGWTAVRWRMQGLEEAFGLELIILFALTGLAAILSIVALALQFRARKQQPKVFWFFRKHHQTQSHIPYIVPHPVNVIVAATLATSLIMLTYLAFSYDAWLNDRPARAIRIASWFPVVWLTFFAAVWLSGFGSLYLTYLAPSQFTRRGSLTGVQRRISPLIVNVLCYGVPALTIASIMPLQHYQSQRMRDAMRMTKYLNDNLASLSEEFRGEGVRREQIEALLAQARGTHEAIWEWRQIWRSELGIWSVYTILAMGVAIPLCMFFVLGVHRRIRTMAANQVHQPGLQINEVSLPPAVAGNSRSFDSSSSDNSQPRKIAFDLQGSTVAGPASLNRLYIPSPVSSTGARSTFTMTPNTSSPNSALPTPSVTEFSSPPFFLTPASSDAHLAKSSFDSLATQSTKGQRPQHLRSPSLSKPNLQHLRRVSQYAIFPGSSQMQLSGMSEEGRASASQLNKRYWHVALQYMFICAVMATISAFALYEASSDLAILTDCRRTNIAVVVCSFIFCVLANIWLIVNIHRLATQQPVQRELPSSQNTSPRGSTVPGLGTYTLDKVRRNSPPDVLQLRKPSALPVDPLEEIEEGEGDTTPIDEGLRIQFGGGHSSSRPAYDTRRRSSCRGPSMDFMEALSLEQRS